ncbi:double-strand break repair protein AddB [Pseudooceanicola aestuarii]|uniref:double-strand break repair protein AddB n=1 Tax=Pseudooceanicola aestuarii TaxID=2697319 RepID=UPI0013D8110B|nr:double-strand break repair protein AddB [Pseudooceanicola aestuarii]
MFDPTDQARLFGLPPGADFPRALIDGLRDRLAHAPPHEIGRTVLIVNTRRMARRLRALFDAGPPALLPRIMLVTDLALAGGAAAAVPPAVSPIRRRLELAQLVGALLEAEPDLAPRAHLYDLADSLAALMDEMQGEGVTPGDIAALDVEDQSGHWVRAQRFLTIVTQLAGREDLPDPEARSRKLVSGLIAHWQDQPPQHPVILAGSTGSRGTTHMLMQAVARLPQGAVVLPGFDFDLPAAVWDGLDDALTGEDHPQFRFARLTRHLELRPDQVKPWAQCEVPQDRNRLISLALRPAPVTHQWLAEGPALDGLATATEHVTLIEAPSMRLEAQAIALRLRKTVEDGGTAALITPNRMLTRQVEAALDGWGIVADDSAGEPLHLTPQGRFLRHVGALFIEDLTAEGLLTLLKHPLCHSGGQRGRHLALTAQLELRLRRHGPAFPDRAALDAFAHAEGTDHARQWCDWLADCVMDRRDAQTRPVATRLATHVALAERLTRGCAEDAEITMWRRDGGEKAQDVVARLALDADHGGTVTARDYDAIFGAILSGEDMRKPGEPRSDILIWGTLEARVQGAGLVILAGLNEGSWPEAPTPDLWLNRPLRKAAGLLLPDRRIGLSAHDFQQAVAAPQVWLTRATKTEGAETVASRWLNRLKNLMSGLPPAGPQAWADMTARGAEWLALARRLEDAGPPQPAPRPSPRPPVAARPRKMSVTEVEKLIRDPYAIYAKKILGLRPLDPLMKAPDARLRGIIAHEVFETFVKGLQDGTLPNTPEALTDVAAQVLSDLVPWTEARLLWHSRIARIAEWFCEREDNRQAHLDLTSPEAEGRAEIPSLGFTLTAKADRVDRDRDGRYRLYDYKTGSAPSAKEQKFFAKQLLLEAAIAERAGFARMGPMAVAEAIYIQLSNDPKEVPVPLEDVPPGQAWEELTRLITAWLQPERGYTSRAAMKRDAAAGDYDLLARFGEWDYTDDPQPEDMP